MSANALRTTGIMAGAALLVGALGLAITGGDPAPGGKTEPRPIARAEAEATGSVRPAEKQEPAQDEPTFETASAPPPAVPAGDVSFVVRFGADHTLARAQNLAAEGKIADANREAERAVSRRRDLRGLCFDRFTVGGAEIVLRACEAVPASEQEAFQRRWSERLQAMSGVEYAEANVILQPERR